MLCLVGNVSLWGYDAACPRDETRTLGEASTSLAVELLPIRRSQQLACVAKLGSDKAVSFVVGVFPPAVISKSKMTGCTRF